MPGGLLFCVPVVEGRQLVHPCILAMGDFMSAVSYLVPAGDQGRFVQQRIQPAPRPWRAHRHAPLRMGGVATGAWHAARAHLRRSRVGDGQRWSAGRQCWPHSQQQQHHRHALAASGWRTAGTDSWFTLPTASVSSASRWAIRACCGMRRICAGCAGSTAGAGAQPRAASLGRVLAAPGHACADGAAAAAAAAAGARYRCSASSIGIRARA